MDLFGDDGTIYYRDNVFNDLTVIIPTDWLFDTAAGTGRPADAGRAAADWAPIDPDIYTLSHGHANGGASHHGGSGEGDTGTISIATEPQPETIVVTGKRNNSGGFDWYVHGTSGTADVPVNDGDASIEPDSQPVPLDEEVVEITIKINRPLTDSEKTALENLKATIAAIETAIRNLADNAILKLANGATVTGADLKALWAKTDFIINDNHVAYGNNSYRGEANMTADGGLISFNIGGDGLDRYDNFDGGMNYLVAHELGHLTQWGTPLVYSEITANDIARALLNGAGLDYLDNPQGGGYTEGAPMQFSVG